MLPLSPAGASAGWQVHPLPSVNLNLLDVALSPAYAQDKLLYVLGWNDGFSLWRGQNGAWTEILRSGGSIERLDRIMLASGGALLACGWQGGIPSIWYSGDNGAAFTVHSAPYGVDCWACSPDGTLFIGGYDGSRALVCGSVDHGASYSSPVHVGDQPLCSLAASPDYAQDGTLFAGGISGRTWFSHDGGAAFSEVISPLAGNISLAFDPDYRISKTVYIAGDAPGAGLYSLKPRAAEWCRLDSGLAADIRLGSVAAAPGGVVYASNYQPADAASFRGGMIRCVKNGPSCEVVLEGLPGGSTLWQLWRSGTRLWAMDTTGNRLLYYDDALGLPVSLKSPADGAVRTGVPAAGNKIKSVTLEWEPLAGAASYEWQVSDSAGFSDMPAFLQGVTAGVSTELPGLEPLTIYCWRVRVVSPLYSPWSAVRLFITTPCEFTAPVPAFPPDVAVDVALRPGFMWSAVNGAASYELNVSTQPDLSSLALQRTTTAFTWQATANLNYGVTYYWRVRVITPVQGIWSEVRSFTTLVDTLDIPLPESPLTGSLQVPLKPLFVWSAVKRATAYEVAVSAQPDFAVLALFKTVSTRNWQSETCLEPQTGYYWRVRALKSGVQGGWSPASFFVIANAPEGFVSSQSPPPVLPPAPTPATVLTTAYTVPEGTNMIQTTAVVASTAVEAPAMTLVRDAGIPGWVYFLPAAAGALVVLLLTVLLLLDIRRGSSRG